MAELTIRRRLMLAGALLVSAALALGSHATAAPAPKLPSVNTGGSAAVSTSSATLAGTVNPHGAETSYVFQYGTTTGYGAQTAPVSAGNGTTGIKVSQPITGLAPDTMYHYRIVATNATGTADGGDVAFTTKSIPLTFKIDSTPQPNVFGSPFTVSGALSGTSAANRTLALQASPFPYLGAFQDTGNTTVTDATGNFSFRVAGPMLNTRFQVVIVGAPTVKSHTFLERVAVRVSLHVRSTGRPGLVRMYGMVTPGQFNARVGLQLLRPRLTPLTIAGTKVIGASSRFSYVLRIRRGGLYRAFVHANSNRLVSGHSRAILIR